MLDRRSFLLGSAATLAALSAAGGAAAALPPARLRRVDAAALSAPIEIVDDPYGVPHIRAGSIPDAFFGQGYVVARDRLFQIDLSHRREMGRLAEAFGPEFAPHDAVARLFHYRGDLKAELAAVPPNILACARAYVAGINARIDEVMDDPAQLPLEYHILGVSPLKWDVEDLVLARNASIGNMDDEVRRARLAGMGLLELDEVVAPLRPAWPLAVPDGLDAAAVTETDLGVLRLGRLPFGALVPKDDPDGPRTDATERANAGSNAWTVGPRRTATGRPILANDPHLGIGGFGPRHVAHLSAPGLDVIGGGAPGLPGIMQGHTDRFAFGRTNFHIDQEDLFILELHPEDPERYRHDGGWKRFERVELSIPVKDAPPKAVTLRYAVQGPVVAHDPAKRRASAVATIELQPGGSGAFAMIAINLARDWASLHGAAFRFHPSPTNFHYADVDGNHGWQVIGYVPVRRRGEGLMPVPGDGRYDWTGMRDFRALPSEYNPAKGWFASANQNNLPPDWPRDRIPAFSFRDPYRYERVASVLAAQPKHRLADSIALQHDTFSEPARQLIALLPKGGSAGAEQAIAMLRGWDARLDRDSGPAALFEILWRELGTRMLAAIVPERAKALVTEIAPSVLLGLLERPDARLGAAPAKARDALFDAALAAAWQSASAQLGPDPAAWRWGALHQVRITHPLARIPAIAAAFPPIESEGSGGDSYTVMARWLRDAPGWQVSGGASYLQVIDVGAWDNSVMLNLPGQSNDPRSPHYSDFYRPWIRGEMQPMLFSRAAVDAHVTARTVLRPGR
ncbi:penicillin acylase family protein [Sphingomonas sp. MAH-20]|uniref:Penicillin acylase family protein n=1 Tax=Sphingomonas horti TaxID=2682842 RepID=A0A6I4IWK6_9SPHN|nr:MULTISPECIES: penicillin acylase family protein [Sphingomonas]MBA2920201.1 penicillin acylase family protein [Sphingomonas sp. CGMCC 1.13658]MVO76456.1 penicillin acylase family protein [Sphingomonas horti]